MSQRAASHVLTTPRSAASPMSINPHRTASPMPNTPHALASYPANIDLETISSYGTYNAAALTNPTISAVDINLNWINVEPGQGVFNWAPADQEMAAWVAHGKKFTLIVRYIKEGASSDACTSAQFLPAWEIARIQSLCSHGILLPDYFDPTFTADLKGFVNAIAEHIDASLYKQNLLYIRIGVGEGGEGFPFNPNYASEVRPQFEAWGYTPTHWAAWQKELMAYYQSVFPQTTIIYPVNSQDTDPATGQNVSVENANWAAAYGFGVGQQGLQPGTNSPLLQSLRVRYPTLYIQYQTIGVVDSYTAVQADIQAAEINGAQSIEWYSPNAVDPTYQSLFVQWQQTVNSKFGGIASSP